MSTANLRTPYGHLANKAFVDPHVLLNIEPSLTRIDFKVTNALSQLSDQIYLPFTDRFLRTRFDYGFVAGEDLKQGQRSVVEQLFKAVSVACDAAVSEMQRLNTHFADTFDAAAAKDFDLTDEQRNYTRKRMQSVVFDRIAEAQATQTKLQDTQFEKTMHLHFLNFKLNIDSDGPISTNASRKESRVDWIAEENLPLRHTIVERTKGVCRDRQWHEIKDEARETLITQSTQNHNPFEEEPNESDPENSMFMTDNKQREIEENQPKINEPNSRDMEEESMKIPEDIAPKLSPEELKKLELDLSKNPLEIETEDLVLKVVDNLPPNDIQNKPIRNMLQGFYYSLLMRPNSSKMLIH